MVTYRITRRVYAHQLNGEGARRYGGRWNVKGTAVIYTAEHQSLATLELLANTINTALPDDLVVLSIRIPDEASLIEWHQDSLPVNWRSYPAIRTLAEQGTDWINSHSSLLLKVPSVLVPEECNILINPAHKEFDAVRIESTDELSLDDRLAT